MRNFKAHLTILCLGIASLSQAQWLVQTNVVPGVSATGTFLGGTGAYSGSVNTSISNVVDGMANGVPGISSGSISALTPTFLANYTPNPGSLPFLNVAGNDSGDSYKVTMDFTGLGSGYLPAGSLIGYLDVDIEEQLDHYVAFDTSANQITSPWLAAASATSFDYNFTDTFDFINPAFVSVVTNAGGVYTFAGDSANQNSAFQGFNTTQNITKMEWVLQRPIGFLAAGGYGYGIAIQSASPVPEPATCVFLGLGALGLLRRKRSQ
jgi:hypothetical protein